MMAGRLLGALACVAGGAAIGLRKHSTGDVDGSVLQRMQYWSKQDNPLPSTGKYLLFTTDAGGLNNIRIAWEMTGIVALRSGRTLVLPPSSPMYLLDFGPWNAALVGDTSNWTGKTLVEELIDLKQLKGTLPTLTAEEFEAEAGIRWDTARGMADVTPEKKSWDICHFSDWDRFDSKFVFMSGKGQRREAFGCGEWWLRGGPRTELRNEMTEPEWALLRHGFVWHPDAFAIASKVVDYLGMFEYMSLHARYGDFAEHQAQRTPDDIYKNWKTLIDSSTALYVATDRQEEFGGFASRHNGVRVVMWPDLFDDTTGGILLETRRQYSPERWYKLTGLVEELICTYAKVFVGTDRSSFTGHIERMRIHAEAPVTMRLVHTNGDFFLPGGKSRSQSVPLEKIQASIDEWKGKKWEVAPITKGDMFGLKNRTGPSIPHRAIDEKA